MDCVHALKFRLLTKFGVYPTSYRDAPRAGRACSHAPAGRQTRRPQGRAPRPHCCELSKAVARSHGVPVRRLRLKAPVAVWPGWLLLGSASLVCNSEDGHQPAPDSGLPAQTLPGSDLVGPRLVRPRLWIQTCWPGPIGLGHQGNVQRPGQPCSRCRRKLPPDGRCGRPHHLPRTPLRHWLRLRCRRDRF